MIIFDSSTLILLAKIHLLDLFVLDFPGLVVIPEQVKMEVSAKDREEVPLILSLIKDKKIKVQKVKNKKELIKLMADFNIDLGETGAIAIAVNDKNNVLATDDRNAIRACKILKIDYVTSISILIRAFEKGLLEKEETLIKLQNLQLFGRFKKEIIEGATKQIRREA
jgi:predicted nucleic acid-binding protein